MTENVWDFAWYGIQRLYYAPRLAEPPLGKETGTHRGKQMT
jgi:hypothetical protein